MSSEVVARFVDVDLDIKSAMDLTELTAAFARRAVAIHSGRFGRRYWVRFELLRHPRNPDDGIKRFIDLASSLRGTAGEAWDKATKEFDIGIEGGSGSERDPAVWVIRPQTLRAAARVDVQLRLTVYAPPGGGNRTKTPLRAD
jgi:hypothetical protein